MRAISCLPTANANPSFVLVRHQNLAGKAQLFLAQLIASQSLRAMLMRLDTFRPLLIKLRCRSENSGAN